MNNEIAVIILNYNTWPDTINEARDIRERFKVPCNDIIVVDNNSTNESAAELQKACSDSYRLVLSSENKGYAAGNNIGLRLAATEGYRFALIVNNDIIFQDDSLIYRLSEIMRKDSSIGAISPDVYTPEGRLYNRVSIRPNFWDMTMGLPLYKMRCRRVKNRGDYGYIYRPQGCCMMVDLEKMRQVDFLDENTFLYSEETILAEKLLKNHYRCAVCLSNSIIHNHSKTVKCQIDKKKIEKIKLDSHNYLLREYRNYPEWKIKIANLFDKIIFALTT